MTKLRFQIAKILLAAIISLSAAACTDNAQERSNRPIVKERIVESHPLKIYPEAEEVRLFIGDLPLGENGFYGMSNPDGRKLTTKEKHKFEQSIDRKVIIQPSENGEDAYEAACFIPHHFFRYFDQTGNQIGEIEICFCCEGGLAKPALMDVKDDEWVDYDIASIKELVKSMNLPTDVNCDE